MRRKDSIDNVSTASTLVQGHFLIVQHHAFKIRNCFISLLSICGKTKVQNKYFIKIHSAKHLRISVVYGDKQYKAFKHLIICLCIVLES